MPATLDGTNGLTFNDGSIQGSVAPAVRQTVLSGPVNVNGFAAFVGATGSTTVTATGTLLLSAAAGGNANRAGSITNPSWTGLSTNGTMFLFLDITAAGVVTAGSTTLAPTYRWGGADVVTNNQNTFNIQAMEMKVGNGSVATQVFRVFVGEVTVAGAVVTAITWYQLMGRYKSADVAGAGTATATSFNHRLGYPDVVMWHFLRCTTAQLNFSIGDVFTDVFTVAGTNYIKLQPRQANRNTATVITASTTAYGALDVSTANLSGLTSANFNQFLLAQRPW